MSPSPCANECGFFGSLERQNLCSKCYDEFLEEVRKLTSNLSSMQVSPNLSHLQEQEIMKLASNLSSMQIHSRKRCHSCNSKVGLLGFECRRCNEVFCGTHRHSETHSCTFDYKTFGRDQLARDTPAMRPDKLDYRV